MADAEAKFLRVDRVENKKNVPGKTGSLLGIAEFWTERDNNVKKTANNGTSTPHPRGEKIEYESSTPQTPTEIKPLKMPSIILPPSFKRKASAPARPEANETQHVATSESNVPKEVRNGSEAKRSRTVVPNEVVRESQSQAKPRIRVSTNIPGQAAQQEKSGKKKKSYFSAFYSV